LVGVPSHFHYVFFFFCVQPGHNMPMLDLKLVCK
jgi:hypothetical protein